MPISRCAHKTKCRYLLGLPLKFPSSTPDIFVGESSRGPQVAKSSNCCYIFLLLHLGRGPVIKSVNSYSASSKVKFYINLTLSVIKDSCWPVAKIKLSLEAHRNKSRLTLDVRKPRSQGFSVFLGKKEKPWERG